MSYVENGYVEAGYFADECDTGLYVENGYIEDGYFEGCQTGFVVPDIAKAKLKFFISRGVLPEDDEINQVKSSLGENEIGVLYMPALKKFLLVNNQSFVEFITNALDMATVERELKNSSSFVDFLNAQINSNIDARLDLDYISNQLLNYDSFITNIVSAVVERLSVRVNMVAPDGTVLASPTITRDGATFTFDIPPELSGIEYGVSIEITGA